jgi:sugar phosphate isomerase/epimerase
LRLCLNRVTLSPTATAAEFLRAAHGVGFPAVELSARRLAAALEANPGIGDLLGHGGVVPVHGGWSIRLHWQDAAFTAALPVVAAEMEFAAGLGSRSGALVLPTMVTDIAGLADRIRRVADLAASHDLDVVCEYIGTAHGTGGERYRAGGQECRTLGGALRVVEAVDRPNVGILVDTFHWHASAGTVDDLAGIPARMPVVVHLNDAPPRNAVLLDDSMRLLPGNGVIDLPGFLNALAARAYQGPLSVELKNPVLHAMDPQEAARLAYAAGAAVLGRALPDGSLGEAVR